MLSNAEIAERLDAFGVLLELAGAQPYTSRAYRRAADMIRETPVPIVELVRQGRVRELRGIGPGIERRLQELVETGEIQELAELEQRIRPELIGLGRYLGVSPQPRGRDRRDPGRVDRRRAEGGGRGRPADRGSRDRTEDRGEAGRDAHTRRIDPRAGRAPRTRRSRSRRALRTRSTAWLRAIRAGCAT